jgi:hypothetical protein
MENKFKEHSLDDGMSRRDFIKRGVLAGLGLAMGTKGVLDGLEKMSTGTELSLKGEIKAKEDSIRTNLDSIKGEIQKHPNDEKYIDKGHNILGGYETSFAELKKAKGAKNSESIYLEKLQELDNQISQDELRIKNGMF